MSRSVVLGGTDRCGQCRLPPRWCICDALQPVECPVRVGILLHRREQWRPTSTGRLIERACPAARSHVFHRQLRRDEIIAPDSRDTVWILHPRGAPLDPGRVASTDPARLHVLLLDSAWSESGRMLQSVGGWGQPVRLALEGGGRYWLRDPAGGGGVSTAEALIGLLSTLGLDHAAASLQLHLELQVYASLRARGRREAAAEYLSTSPLPTAAPGILERLQARRPNPSIRRIHRG